MKQSRVLVLSDSMLLSVHCGGAAMGALVGAVPHGLSEMYRTGNKSRLEQRLLNTWHSYGWWFDWSNPWWWLGAAACSVKL